MADKLVLVDGNSLMYRAFHALPLMDNGEGVYTNAVHGFFLMLMKVFKDEAPSACAVAFDRHEPTFRHEQYGEYKAGRAPTPDELRPQFGLLREILAAMHISVVTCARFEADDILGTLSREAADRGMDALVVTGDRDAFQLARERVTILYTRRGISETDRVTPAYLEERYGLTPEQMIDLKGLMGDASDNIPGVPGVGEKTALKLLKQYGTLEAALDHAEADQKGALRERLISFADQARFSKRMATIERFAPVEVDFDAFELHDLTDALPVLENYKLSTLGARLSQLSKEMRGGAAIAPQARVATSVPATAPVELPTPEPTGMAWMDEDAVAAIRWQPVVACASAEALAIWAASVPADSPCAVALTDRLSVALPDGRQAELTLGGDLLSSGLTEGEALKCLKRLLTGGGAKTMCGVKDARQLIAPEIALGGAAFDVQLAAYVLNPQRASFAAEALLEAGSIPAEDGVTTAARLFALAARQRTDMARDGLTALYESIEMPLSEALFAMERVGFLVDDQELERLGQRFGARIEEVSTRIREIAGTEVNLNSPKQLGELLFDQLKLTGGRKTARGYSTTAEILESIADQHEIVPLILTYRKYFKLMSTYIDALRRLRGPDGRIHTSFDQVSTSTGRISSLEPNLQNIPVRTAEGREIRRAFVARPGWLLIDADYSQIELRVLAHMSGDEVMLEAFRLGQDIHRRTAAEVYGVPLGEVTPDMRSAAKAVNFGIVYGISDFGLARNIGVSRGEAALFIARYFERYPRVKRFMDEQVTLGKTQGYVVTLFGRRRYLAEMESGNRNVRAFGERAAMNSPIQGTAADIIKIAMVAIDRALQKAGLAARLILQVHDELIIECPEAEREQASALLKAAMEGAASLDAKLVVDLSTGRNWHECKG